MAIIGVADNKRQFTNTKGQPFFILGTNYEGYFDRAWRMWDDGKFDPDLIKHDFRKIADTGLNVVRLFVLPALDKELRAGDFSKLDRVLQIAADHNQLVLLTFNDAHSLNLAYAADLDAKIAERYQDDPVIFGWDLENEPRFYNFVAAIYPQSHPAAVQTSALVNHYGPRVSLQETVSLQRDRRIPGHLSPQLAYYYYNALQYFIDFAEDADRWAAQTGKTVVEFTYTEASAKWHKLIGVLNDTVAAWIAARGNPVRRADPNHLITIGYNWIYLAALPANRALGFQQYHKYGTASLSYLNQTLKEFSSLQNVYPDHPLLIGEFGYSNQSSTNPASTRPVSEKTTALFEGATLAYLKAHTMAGGLKWMLNDVDASDNPYEANFGIYRQGDHAKAIQPLLAELTERWIAPGPEADLKLIQDAVGLAMRFNMANQIILSGGIFQDESFSWRADGVGHCFIDLASKSLTLQALGRGQFAVDPWEVVPDWEPEKRAILYQMINNQPVEQASFPPYERITWTVTSGVTYRLGLAAEPEPPDPGDDPIIVPNPGEHVIVLADPNNTLRFSIPYIRKFAPDISFAPDRVAGRWSYVTIIATEAEVSSNLISTIKAKGAQIVDRISGDIRTIIDDLVSRNQRFLSKQPTPPITDPPSDPITPEEPAETEIYTVQPGDTLSKIALKVYGKSSQWTVIFEANRDMLDSPSLIRPGMQLKIPPAL